MWTRSELIEQLEALHELAVAENRDLTDAEDAAWRHIKQEIEEMDKPSGTLRLAAAPAIVTKQRTYSIAKAIGYCLGDGNAGDVGLEKEIHVQLSKQRPDAHGVLVPLSAILTTKSGQDTITAGPPSVGSVLAQTDRLMDSLLADAEAALRKATILGPLGVQVVAVPDAQKVRVPRKISGGVAGWIARDADATTATDLTFDDVQAEAHSLSVQARINRSALLYTNPAMEAVVRADLSSAVADGLNSGYLNGSGATNQPVGLVKALTDASRDFTTELNGTPERYDFFDFLISHVEAYAEEGESRKWLLHPATLASLITTPAWSTAQVPISDGTNLCNLPFVQSGRAEKGTPTAAPYLVCGDFGSSFMFSFGPSIDLMANPYHDDVWASGGVLIRGILDADFVFRDLKRLAMASDVLATGG